MTLNQETTKSTREEEMAGVDVNLSDVAGCLGCSMMCHMLCNNHM